MRYALAYDVVSNGRRARFHKKLKKLMVPVQRSVFEGELGPEEMAEVERLVARTLDLETDSVRLYPLCANCRRGIRHLGTAAPIPDPDAPIVI